MMAQLYAPDRNHSCGLQMFFVQIRDLNTHEPLPGKKSYLKILQIFVFFQEWKWVKLVLDSLMKRVIMDIYD
jgi:hypothetical protein